MVATPYRTLEETAAQKHSQEKQAFTAEQNRGKKQFPKGIHELANLPAPLDCFLPHCSPLPTLTTGADANLAREKWCHPKPNLLYLFWEKWRQVQPNEFGRMPGPVAALELAAACVDKQESERTFPEQDVARGG